MMTSKMTQIHFMGTDSTQGTPVHYIARDRCATRRPRTATKDHVCDRVPVSCTSDRAGPCVAARRDAEPEERRPYCSARRRAASTAATAFSSGVPDSTVNSLVSGAS